MTNQFKRYRHRFRNSGFATVWIVAAILCNLCLTEMGRSDDRTAKVSRASDAAADRDAVLSRSLSAANPSKPTQQHIPKLIRQLGSSGYTARRAAANELRQIGAEAFDLLHAATGDSDPEVAASAHYLLRQITVRWVQNDDSGAVRRLLRDYGSQPDEHRLRRVQALATLAEGDGVAALCRVARFDRSPLVSRTAALAIIRPINKSAAESQVDPDVVTQELAASTREAATWLRQYLAQLRDPAASVEFWRQLIDAEAARLEQNADDTSAQIVLGLLRNLADVYRQLGETHALAGLLDRMIELDADTADQTTVDLLAWLTEHQSWDVLDEFLSKHQVRLHQSKRPLYYAALARARQGNSELAEQLAAKAAELDPQAALAVAKDLEEHGQFEWAVREYRQAIDNGQVASHEGILARIYLASLLHDYEQHREAADALESLVKALRGEGRVAKLYAEIQQYFQRRGDVEAIAARLHYYRACQYRDEKDSRRSQDELELAIKFDPTDADVLIAMYRLPEADAKWREATRQRIRNLCRQFEQDIEEEPTTAMHYNQWAWLVGNTEGDFQKAIRYSHRSLELDADRDSAAASYLDTLGRCYYAAGDYKNAVKYQRQALEKIDYMQVMHRQLALFEKTLAEKQGARSTEHGAESPD